MGKTHLVYCRISNPTRENGVAPPTHAQAANQTPRHPTRLRCSSPPQGCQADTFAVCSEDRWRTHGATKVLAARTRPHEVPQPRCPHDDRPNCQLDRLATMSIHFASPDAPKSSNS